MTYPKISGATIFYSWDQLRLWLVQTHNIARPEDAADMPQILEQFSVTDYVAPPVEPIDYTESNKAQLWQAAHDYEFQRISGAALSLLALGVAQSKPKCSAVAMWLKGLWDDNYYPRKAQITSEQITQLQLDFSVVGEMPYTVQEMSAEVYGA